MQLCGVGSISPNRRERSLSRITPAGACLAGDALDVGLPGALLVSRVALQAERLALLGREGLRGPGVRARRPDSVGLRVAGATRGGTDKIRGERGRGEGEGQGEEGRAGCG